MTVVLKLKVCFFKIEAIYERAVVEQKREVEEIRKNESLLIPDDINYNS